MWALHSHAESWLLMSVWADACAIVLQFLNPWIMVKKGGKLPPGHINDWFWEDKDMKDYMATRLPKGTMAHHPLCMYSTDPSLTHLSTCSLTHSFTHSLMHCLTHTHSLTHSLTHPLTHSLTHPEGNHMKGVGSLPAHWTHDICVAM